MCNFKEQSWGMQTMVGVLKRTETICTECNRTQEHLVRSGEKDKDAGRKYAETYLKSTCKRK